MKKILKGAVVLLIAIAMVFSTVAIADTNDKETLQTWASNPIKPSGIVNPNQGNNRDIIWHNGEPSADANLYSSQFDECYPFVSQVADDFHFEEDTYINDVHWWGGFWGGDPIECIDFWIYFYADDGSGNQPTGAGMDDPSETALAAYFFPGVCGELDPNGFYEYDAVLDPPFLAEGCQKYWIAIQGVFCFPPQWGWANTDGIQLHSAVQGFPVLNMPFWTVIDPEVDMAWYLTYGEPCEPCIDVEKFVWDKWNQEWVDADTEAEAVDVRICNDITYKIVVHNCGDTDITNIVIEDKMHDSLKFITGDPEPDEYYYEKPFWYMTWYFPGPLKPCETIEVYITAHVEGPECSNDYNYVLVKGDACGNVVRDDDYCWVHCHNRAKEFNTPILNWLQSHPNMFPLLQVVLQRLGLF